MQVTSGRRLTDEISDMQGCPKATPATQNARGIGKLEGGNILKCANVYVCLNSNKTLEISCVIYL